MSATYVEIKNLRLDVHEDKEYNFICLHYSLLQIGTAQYLKGIYM